MARRYKRSSIYRRYFNYYRNALLRTGAKESVNIPKTIGKREYSRLKKQWNEYRKAYERETGLRPQASGEYKNKQGNIVDVETGEILDNRTMSNFSYYDNLVNNFLEMMGRLQSWFDDCYAARGRKKKNAFNREAGAASRALERFSATINRYDIIKTGRFLANNPDFAEELGRVTVMPYTEWVKYINLSLTRIDNYLAGVS